MNSTKIRDKANELNALELFGGNLKEEFKKTSENQKAGIWVNGVILRIDNKKRLLDALDMAETELIEQLREKRQEIKELVQ